ncbi:MAG: protein arginine kinase [Clostridia bacterium]|jgi:protein arginine kinase|nr:protein arginine kinase [Clostridia bacterium]
MNTNKLLDNAQTKWTSGGNKGDIVISSRIRLARNLAAKPFPHLLTEAAARQLALQVREALAKSNLKYFYVDMENISPIDRQILVEKHLISPALLDDARGRGVAVSEDEAVSIMVNEEDHLRIQCLYGGLALNEAWQDIDVLDQKLSENLNYAYDQELGYLTACPTNVGTGLRASVMLHLPALTMLKKTGQIFESLGQMGFAIRGIFGEGSESKGHLYQISNQRTLGFSEKDIVERLNRVVEQLAEAETKARKDLFKKNQNSMADYIWRAWGIMTNARSMSSAEAMEKLSALRLGVSEAIIKQTNNVKLNQLLISIQPGFVERKLQTEAPNSQISTMQRDWARAEIIRNQLLNINNNK